MKRYKRFISAVLAGVMTLCAPYAAHAQVYAPAEGPTYWTGASVSQLGNEIVPSGTAPVTVNAGTGAIGLTAPLGGLTAAPSNGQIPIGNGTAYTPATITAGNNVSITNGAGSITAQIRSVVGINNAGSPYTYSQTSATYTVCDTTSGSITINLPAISAANYKHFIFKKSAAANTVSIVRNGSDAFDSGATTYTLSGINDWVEIQAGAGAIWYILGGARLTGTTATAKQFLTNIGTDGVQNKAQPTQQDIAGVARFDCRLSASATEPIPTSDITGATSVYIHPYNGTTFSCLESSVWVPKKITGIITIALGTLTSNKPYDVFVYDADGDGEIEAGEYDVVGWTSTTARSVALDFSNANIPVKTGATSRTFIGTFYTLSTTTTEDSTAVRGVSSYWNRSPRLIMCRDSTDSWSYGPAGWRFWNGSSTAGVGVTYMMCCASDIYAEAQSAQLVAADSGEGAATAIGLNSGSAVASQIFTQTGAVPATGYYRNVAYYRGCLAGTARLNYLSVMEYAYGSGAVTFYGDAASPSINLYGLVGTVWM